MTMTTKRNEKCPEKKPRHAMRKLSVGFVSCMIGYSVFCGGSMPVHAADIAATSQISGGGVATTANPTTTTTVGNAEAKETPNITEKSKTTNQAEDAEKTEKTNKETKENSQAASSTEKKNVDSLEEKTSETSEKKQVDENQKQDLEYEYDKDTGNIKITMKTETNQFRIKLDNGNEGVFKKEGESWNCNEEGGVKYEDGKLIIEPKYYKNNTKITVYCHATDSQDSSTYTVLGSKEIDITLEKNKENKPSAESETDKNTTTPLEKTPTLGDVDKLLLNDESKGIDISARKEESKKKASNAEGELKKLTKKLFEDETKRNDINTSAATELGAIDERIKKATDEEQLNTIDKMIDAIKKEYICDDLKIYFEEDTDKKEKLSEKYEEIKKKNVEINNDFGKKNYNGIEEKCKEIDKLYEEVKNLDGIAELIGETKKPETEIKDNKKPENQNKEDKDGTIIEGHGSEARPKDESDSNTVKPEIKDDAKVETQPEKDKIENPKNELDEKISEMEPQGPDVSPEAPESTPEVPEDSPEEPEAAPQEPDLPSIVEYGANLDFEEETVHQLPLEHGYYAPNTQITFIEDTKPEESDTIISGNVIDFTEDSILNHQYTESGHNSPDSNQDILEDTMASISIGGQNEFIDTIEDTQLNMSGHSDNTTIIEDTKQSEIIIGGQGNIEDMTEDTQTSMSGSNESMIIDIEEEDTHPKLQFHFDNTTPTPTLEQKISQTPDTKVENDLPQTGEQAKLEVFFTVTALTIIGAAGLLSKKCLENEID